MTMGLDELLSDPPLAHKGGQLVWGLSEDVLRYIDQTLQPGDKTLETGAGMSTMLFALKSSEHTCITPSENEVDLLRAYADKKGISLEHVTFIVKPSQDVMPYLDREELALVLIDGGHGYPIPAIDWFYSTPMLKVGGVVIVDDVHVWTGLELKRFLAEEATWKLVRNFDRSVAYEKLAGEYAKEWRLQPYTLRKSRIPQMANVLGLSLKLLVQGDFSELRKRTRNYIAKRW